MIWCCLIIIPLLFTLLKLYIKLQTSWCESPTCLVGKTAIVTGANTGIGYVTALDFAKRGARVILACRDEERARQAKENIVEATGNENIIVRFINLSSLQTIREFVKGIEESESKIDILVNNAGAGGLADKKTIDGLQIQMQINYFGPFLLTILLLELLKKSPASRIINVSSLAAKYAKFDIDRINKFDEGNQHYSKSKLCNILFTMELAKRLNGTTVTVYSLHPGVVKTDIFRRYRGFRKTIYEFISSIYFKTCEEGAQTTIYTAVEKAIEKYSGCHFAECKVVPTYPTAAVPGRAEQVWTKTEELLNLKPMSV